MYKVLLKETDLFKEYDRFINEDGYYYITQVIKECNKIRLESDMSEFRAFDYLKLRTTKEFFEAINRIEGIDNIWIKGKRGVNSKGALCHPLVFVDIVLLALPHFKVDVYMYIWKNGEELFKNVRYDRSEDDVILLERLFYMNYSGDNFPRFIIDTCNKIKAICNHKGSWNTANKEQLELKDKIYNEIFELSKTITNPNVVIEQILIKYNKELA